MNSLVSAVKDKWTKRNHRNDPEAQGISSSSRSESSARAIKNKETEQDQTEVQNTHRELYFAYGSCMSEDFARSVPEFVCLGHAVLRDYRLAFTRYSYSRGGGVADIVPVKNSTVEGVLYELDSDLLPELDIREGVKSGAYQRIRVIVETPYGQHRAWTYEVIEKEEEELPPTAEYARLVLSGAMPVVSHAYFKRLKAHIDALQDDRIDNW